MRWNLLGPCMLLAVATACGSSDTAMTVDVAVDDVAVVEVVDVAVEAMAEVAPEAVAELPIEAVVEVAADVSFTLDTVGLSNLSCKDFYRECVSQCPKGADGQPVPTCFQACHQLLSPEGATTTDAFVKCVVDSGCDLKADDQAKLACYGQTCGDTYFACFHGTSGCKDVLTCAQACPQGTTYGACVVACSQDGTVDAQKQLIAILKCISDNCCKANAADCQTPAGQQCAKDVFTPVTGGQCLQLGLACMGS